MLKQSFIEMGLLKEIPEDKAMFTTQFLPVKAGMSSRHYSAGLPTISGALPIHGPPSSRSSTVSTRKLPSSGAALPGDRDEAIAASG